MMLIIVLSPRLDFLFGILQRQKSVDVEALRSKSAIEGFDRGVVGRLGPTTEVEDYLVRVRPEVHRGAPELAAVVAIDPPRQAAVEAQPLERAHHVLARSAALALKSCGTRPAVGCSRLAGRSITCKKCWDTRTSSRRARISTSRRSACRTPRDGSARSRCTLLHARPIRSIRLLATTSRQNRRK